VSLAPRLREGTYVFAVLPPGVSPTGAVAMMAEDEGVTVVVPAAVADERGLAGEFPSAWITLDAPTLLSGTGLMARVSTALADAGIACNPVAGFHHDHLFVPQDRAAEAVAILRDVELPDGIVRE
jgi:uncharacterized protein